MRIRKLVFLTLFLLLFGTPSLATAQVLINEIAWMGTPIEGVDEKQWWRYEWLELYNPTTESTSVNGWTLQTSDFQIPLWGTIHAQEYFLVGASSKIPNLDINYANLTGKFANAGQKVLLKDAAGTIVDEVDARDGWQAGDNTEKLTMEKRISGEWASSLTVGGTPRAANTEAKQKSTEEGELPIAQYSRDVFNVLPFLFALVGVLLLARHLLKQGPESEV
ncbi:lamin tail domain-containing protein [Patescibacteria group bacterium]|nr:lamin tail domain-containing protein [Patescibacteria group bacterium]